MVVNENDEDYQIVYKWMLAKAGGTIEISPGDVVRQALSMAASDLTVWRFYGYFDKVIGVYQGKLYVHTPDGWSPLFSVDHFADLLIPNPFASG